MSHPEAGHIRVGRLPRDGMPGEPGSFEGGCPYHADCVEGMANAAAIARRCGCHVSELSEVPDEHEAWDAAAHYVAGLCSVLVMTASPQRIVLGGGVLQRKTLVTKVRAQLKRQLGGYVTHDLVSSKRGLVEFVGAFIFGYFWQSFGNFWQWFVWAIVLTMFFVYSELEKRRRRRDRRSFGGG